MKEEYCPKCNSSNRILFTKGRIVCFDCGYDNR